MATIDVSRLETVRRDRGFSQRTLARAADITRQAVGAIEKGRMQPSVGIALRLGQALGTTVEALFGIPADPPRSVARAATATIEGRTVTYALDADHLAIEPGESAVPNVFVGGCDLSAGLLTRHAMARSRDFRVLWLSMTNRAALDALGRGRLHAAVVHGASSIDRTVRRLDLLRFELATTEAGWLVRRDNRARFRRPADFARGAVRVANRPAGAGARTLLDAQLRRANVDPQQVRGYDRELAGQLDVGRAVAQDFADVALGNASVARLFDLQFVPLCEERCTFVIAAAALRTPEIRALLDALRSEPYRRDLSAMQSYDTTKTGEHIA